MAHDDPDFERKLGALADERTTLGTSTTDQAKSLFEENLIPSVLSIVNTAVHSPNDKLRFDAAKYVVERNLGRLGDPEPEGGKDVFAELLEAIASNDSPSHSNPRS